MDTNEVPIKTLLYIRLIKHAYLTDPASKKEIMILFCNNILIFQKILLENSPVFKLLSTMISMFPRITCDLSKFIIVIWCNTLPAIFIHSCSSYLTVIFTYTCICNKVLNLLFYQLRKIRKFLVVFLGQKSLQFVDSIQKITRHFWTIIYNLQLRT